MATYDRLLIATGSDPIVLPLPGKELPGVVTFRDLDDVEPDARALGRRTPRRGHRRRLVRPRSGARAALRGMHVTVVHLLDTLMERQLDAPAGALLQGGAGEARHRIPHAREDRRRSSAASASRA